MRNEKILLLTETALAAALAVVLGLWEIRLPVALSGGSISLAMLPIVAIALRRGFVAGGVVGAFYGSIDLIMGKAYILHWAQVLLDYPLPYLTFGLIVGLFSTSYLRLVQAKSIDRNPGAAICSSIPNATATSNATNVMQSAKAADVDSKGIASNRGKTAVMIVAAIVCGGVARYICHVFSGAIFFAEYAGDLNPWVYSFVYNASYLLPTLIAVAVVSLLVMPALEHALPVQRVQLGNTSPV